jgi:hypothetical protein
MKRITLLFSALLLLADLYPLAAGVSTNLFVEIQGPYDVASGPLQTIVLIEETTTVSDIVNEAIIVANSDSEFETYLKNHPNFAWRLYTRRGERLYFDGSRLARDLAAIDSVKNSSGIRVKLGSVEDLDRPARGTTEFNWVDIHQLDLLNAKPEPLPSLNSNISKFKTRFEKRLKLPPNTTVGEVKKIIMELFPSKNDLSKLYFVPSPEQIILHDGQLLAPALRNDNELVPWGEQIFAYVVAPIFFLEGIFENRLNFYQQEIKDRIAQGKFDSAYKIWRALDVGLLGPFSKGQVANFNKAIKDLREETAKALENEIEQNLTENQEKSIAALQQFDNDFFTRLYPPTPRFAAKAYAKYHDRIAPELPIKFSQVTAYQVDIQFISKGEKLFSIQTRLLLPLGANYAQLRSGLASTFVSFNDVEGVKIKPSFIEQWTKHLELLANEQVRLPLKPIEVNVEVPVEFLPDAQNIEKQQIINENEIDFPKIMNEISGIFNFGQPDDAEKRFMNLMKLQIRNSTKQNLIANYNELRKNYTQKISSEMKALFQRGVNIYALKEAEGIKTKFLALKFPEEHKQQITQLWDEMNARYKYEQDLDQIRIWLGARNLGSVEDAQQKLAKLIKERPEIEKDAKNFFIETFLKQVRASKSTDAQQQAVDLFLKDPHFSEGERMRVVNEHYLYKFEQSIRGLLYLPNNDAVAAEKVYSEFLKEKARLPDLVERAKKFYEKEIKAFYKRAIKNLRDSDFFGKDFIEKLMNQINQGPSDDETKKNAQRYYNEYLERTKYLQ